MFCFLFCFLIIAIFYLFSVPWDHMPLVGNISKHYSSDRSPSFDRPPAMICQNSDQGYIFLISQSTVLTFYPMKFLFEKGLNARHLNYSFVPKRQLIYLIEHWEGLCICVCNKFSLNMSFSKCHNQGRA